MYAVVGCGECGMLWVTEGRPETSQCRRCGTRRPHEKRRRFATTDDRDHAREVRAALLASRQGHEDAFDDLDSYAELADRLDDADADDADFLATMGVDPAAVEAAGERASGAAQRRSRRAIIRAAVRNLDAPSETAIVEHAREQGVDPSNTRQVLAKLVDAGEAIERGGEYRLL